MSLGYLYFAMASQRVFLFLINLQMTLAATGTLETEAKFQCLLTIVRGEALRQFDLLSDDVKIWKTP